MQLAPRLDKWSKQIVGGSLPSVNEQRLVDLVDDGVVERNQAVLCMLGGSELSRKGAVII